MGRKVKLRPDWEGIKLATMEGLLRQKFAPGSELARKLLATQPLTLVEGNTWNDSYWGCVKTNDKWVGDNNLGILLMKIREDLYFGTGG